MLMREKASTLDNVGMDKDARQDEMEMQRAEMMEKGDAVRSIRRSHVERREAEEKERLARAQETRDLRIRQIERTYKLAEELSRLKNLEAQELLDLRRSKNASRFTVPCAHEDARARLLENKIRMEVRSTELMKKWSEDKSFNEMQLAKVRENKRQYCADLQNQIIEKRRIVRELSEEKQRERKILEEMAEAIHEEDFRDEVRRKETRARLQAERDIFFEARKKWKELFKATMGEEEKKIGEIIFEKEAQRKKQMEEKSDIQRAREATIEKIARKMLDEEIKMKEREDICNELFLETKRNEQTQEAKRLILEKQRRTEELYDAMVRYKIDNTERKIKERASDEAFTRHLDKIRRKLDEQDNQKREEKRQKNVRYGEELKNIITNNKMKYAIELLARGKEIKNVCVERNDTSRTICNL